MTAATIKQIPSRQGWAIFALCFCVSVLEGYDLQVLAVAAPGLRAQMGLEPSQMGIALSMSLLGLAAGALAGGIIADRIGRRGVLIASVFALGFFTLLTALVPNFDMLLTARLLTGVAIGGAMPNLIATVAVVAGRARMTTLVTAMMCGMPFGGVLSAAAGLFIVPSFGWPGLFVAGGVLTLIVAPLLIMGLPEVGGHGAGLSAERMSPTDALFGAGRAGTTVTLWIVFILTLAVFSLLLGWAPILVIDKGFAPTLAFSVMLSMNLSGIFGALLTGRMCDQFGVRPVMLLVYAGIGVGLALFSWARDPAMMVLASIVAGFFVLGAQFALYGVAPRIYPASLHGAGVGAAAAMGRIGSILGPMLAGWLLSSGMTVETAILAVIPIAIAAGVAIFILTALAPKTLGRSTGGS